MIAASLAVFAAMLGAGLLYAGIDWWVWRGDEAEPAETGDAEGPFASPGEDGVSEKLKPFESDLGMAFAMTGSIGRAQAAFSRAPGPMFVGAVIMLILDWNGSGSDSDSGDSGTEIEYGGYGALESTGSTIAQSQPDLDFTEPAVLGAMAAVLGFVVFCWGLMVLVRAWVAPGWIRLHREAIVEGTGSFGTLFGGFDAFVPMLIWRFLRGLVLAPMAGLVFAPILAAGIQEAIFGFNEIETAFVFAGGGALLAFALWIWVGPTLLLGEFFIALDGDGPLTALKRSWRAAHGNRGHLIGFYVIWGIVSSVLSFLGFLLLCVGALFTFPYARALMDLAWCRGWLLARHGSDAALDWAENRAG